MLWNYISQRIFVFVLGWMHYPWLFVQSFYLLSLSFPHFTLLVTVYSTTNLLIYSCDFFFSPNHLRRYGRLWRFSAGFIWQNSTPLLLFLPGSFLFWVVDLHWNHLFYLSSLFFFSLFSSLTKYQNHSLRCNKVPKTGHCIIDIAKLGTQTIHLQKCPQEIEIIMISCHPWQNTKLSCADLLLIHSWNVYLLIYLHFSHERMTLK